MERDIKIVIIEGEQLLAAALASLCETIHQVSVVGQESNALRAVRLIEQTLPTIALVDIDMTGVDGITLVSRIQNSPNKTKFIMLRGNADEVVFRRAMRAGAMGYLLKSSAVDELETSIYAVAKGRTFITSELSNILVKERNKTSHNAQESLTDRQLLILQLIAYGKANKEIAAAWNLSVRTVEKHRAELMQRLNVHNTADLIRFAVQHDLIDFSKDASDDLVI